VRPDSDSDNDNHWWAKRVSIIDPAHAIVMEFFKPFQDFPPCQKPAALNLDEVMRHMQEQSTSANCDADADHQRGDRLQRGSATLRTGRPPFLRMSLRPS
jgi:hypothetical protein